MNGYPTRAEAVRSAVGQRAVLVLAGVGILAASAWLSVPFYPVPLTMQTLAVLLVGGMLGPVLGVSAVVGYLTLGALGAPVFHGGLGGILVFAGPTGGYLVGFIPAAFLMGWAARLVWSRSWEGARAEGGGDSSFRHVTPLDPAASRPGSASVRLLVLAGGALAASAAIYAFGVPWLSLFGGLGLERAISVGLVPFLLGDALKAAVAVGALFLGSRALARRLPLF